MILNPYLDRYTPPKVIKAKIIKTATFIVAVLPLFTSPLFVTIPFIKDYSIRKFKNLGNAWRQ